MEFIAEVGINHNGSLELAKEMVGAAASAGATTVKFQTYLTDERVAASHGLHEWLRSCELSVEDFAHLKRECADSGVDFLTTVFGIESLNLVSELEISRVKIASFNIGDKVLLSAAVDMGYELLVSTGASEIDEILGCNQVLSGSPKSHAFMHCISEYPVSELNHLNLVNISYLRKLTSREVGFSDHSTDTVGFFAAAVEGAGIFERHFTSDNSLPGPDQVMSSGPGLFSEAIEAANRGKAARGEVRTGIYSYERGALAFKKTS